MVALRGITKKYGEQTVLSNISLFVKDGESLCLMGPSGSGKTTLLLIAAGLIMPDEGSVSGVKKGRLSMVFQEDRLIEDRDAFTNLSLVLKKKWTREKMRLEYAGVGLLDYEGKPVSEFSGGMKRRVAIVRAVCVQSDLVLMDEPYQGLDADVKEQVIRYVREKTIGKTVIMVSHDPEEARQMGARILELKDLK